MPCSCTVCDPTSKHPYCICDKSWFYFQDEFDKLVEFSKLSPLIKKEFGISTITLCTNFNSHIDLKKLSEIYKNSIKYNPKGKKSKRFKDENNDCFYNSLIMNMQNKYQTFGYVSVKFFPNGKLQIAGCKNIMSCAYAIRKAFSRIIKNNCFLDKPKITNSRIVMINSDFKLSYNIEQLNMCEILNDFNIHDKNGNFTQINYQNAKYPAINAKAVSYDKIQEYKTFLGIKETKKFPGVISLLIFRPGSVILTGGNNIKYYAEIFKQFVNDIVEPNKDFVLDTE